MDGYRKRIDLLISKADGEVALNGSSAHAAIVIERMVARAHYTVRIMTRYLDPQIYCDHKAALAVSDFLKSGKNLEVLVDEDHADSSDHGFFSSLKYENFKIRQVPERLRDSIKLNFSIMDDRGFRLERDDHGTAAIVVFGNKTMTDRLNSLFETVWRQSTQLRMNA